MIVATLDDTIKNVSSLASLTFAIVALFVNRRLSQLDKDKDKIKAWNSKTTGHFLLDLTLLAFLAAATLGLAPLVFAAGRPHIGHVDGALHTLAWLLWFGFLGLTLLQLWVVLRRAVPSVTASIADWKQQRGHTASL